ncbi:type II toxin-antitoxin system VapC family toxin [Dyadobacter sp. CY261]|uniref:type II toxin-antitoxin system VapC family toxin n=1 Tax=Dyadobacter sp. CY261 TaxID=2907203 RepID=UPI001F1E5728|nr:type II toxin-antitoxin system VapC family toxin [Dyadobacter sp. CY261]MCF0071904.1 type II toxin-antitoxin system VapC family toxin [Dyadobacter sp. CY261]
MKILLDTHILLWFLTDDERLRKAHIDLIDDKQNELFFSIGSLWEIAIKAGLFKLTIPNPIDSLVPAEIQLLDIRVSHLTAYQQLPIIHKDPFDRLLIAQARVENLGLLTDDEKFQHYPVKLLG